VESLIQCNTYHDLKRDDYKEVIELCVIFLCGDLQKYVSFKRPGAIHKARWMAKLLYSIKLCLFEEQINELPPGTITTKQKVQKLHVLVDFATLVYIPWWLKSNDTTDAPYNDYTLYKKLVHYAKINR